MARLLDGRVAIVSGAGPGLGRALALAFAREGAAVVLGARDEGRLAAIAADVEAAGGRAAWAGTDVCEPEQCERLAGVALDAFGQVDVLVNNAAVPDGGQPFETADLSRWRRTIEVNVFGSLHMTHAVVPAMKAQQRGSIVFVSSMVVRRPMPNQGGYTASKAALLTAAQVLARELGPHGIRVNSLVPGWIEGPSTAAYFDHVERRTGVPAAEQRAQVAGRIPLGAIPSDADCAAAAVFLASDLSEVVTGQSLDVNGGEVFH